MAKMGKLGCLRKRIDFEIKMVPYRISSIKYRWFTLKERMKLVRMTGPATYLRIWANFIKDYMALRSEYGNRVKKGRLEAFFETGLEGFHWIVQEDGKNGYEGLVPIDNGDYLRIYKHDGSIAFDGTIEKDREAGYVPHPEYPEHGQPNAFGFWIHWTQKGWAAEDWAALFFHGDIQTEKHELLNGPDFVPYRAIIVKSESRE